MLPTCMFVHHVHAWCPGSQKRLLYAPWLELLTIVSCPVGAGNGTQVLWTNSQCS